MSYRAWEMSFLITFYMSHIPKIRLRVCSLNSTLFILTSFPRLFSPEMAEIQLESSFSILLLLVSASALTLTCFPHTQAGQAVWRFFRTLSQHLHLMQRWINVEIFLVHLAVTWWVWWWRGPVCSITTATPHAYSHQGENIWLWGKIGGGVGVQPDFGKIETKGRCYK